MANHTSSRIKPIIFCLALIFICHSNTQSDKEKDDAARRFYDEKAPNPEWFYPIQIYGCSSSTIPEALKIIEEGVSLIENDKINGKGVYLILGPNGNEKTLLANTFGGLDIDAQPKNNLQYYPRYIGEKSDSNAVVEAANLGSDSASGHIAGIYLINTMLKNTTGVKLIFSYKSHGKLQLWNYFNRISEANPKIGMFKISQGESFTLTDTLSNTKIEDFLRLPKFKIVGFGRNPAILYRRDKLEDNFEDNRKHLEQTYAKNQLITGIHIPLLTAYQNCLTNLFHTKIVDDLKNSSAYFLQHFGDLYENKEMTDNDKFSAFQSAFTKLTEITNDITEDMVPDSLTSDLAKYAKELKLDKAADEITELGKSAKILTVVLNTHETSAWLEGLAPLVGYIREKLSVFELAKSGDNVLFECADAAKIKHMLYELEFELEAKPNDTIATMTEFFELNKDILGDGLAEVYHTMLESAQDTENIPKMIMDKLKSYNESECTIPTDGAGKSCDSSASEELIELLGKGSINESNSDDFVTLVLGQKGSKKIEVANVLANFQVDSANVADELIYTEYLNKPINSTYTVVSAPSFSQEKSTAQSVVANYFTHKCIKSALGAKLIITIDKKSLSEGGKLQETLEHAAKIMMGGNNFTSSVGWVVTEVELGEGENLSEKAVTEAENLVKRLQDISKSEKASNETKTIIEWFLSQKDQTKKQTAILSKSQKLDDVKLFSDNRYHLLDLVDKTLNFASYDSKDYLDLLKEDEKELALCSAQETKGKIAENLSSMISEAKSVYQVSEERDDGEYRKVFEQMDHAALMISRLVYNTTGFENVQESLESITDFLAEIEINADSGTFDATEVEVDFVSATGQSIAASFVEGFTELTTYIENSRRYYYFLGNLETWLGEYDVMKKKDEYSSAATELLAKIRTDSAEREDIVNFLDKVEELPKEALKKLLGDEINPSLRKFSYLGYILDRMFSKKMRMECREEVNLCRGAYLKVSSCMDNLCLPGKPIEIGALNIVYLDVDILENSTTVSIFSPEWQIIGNRVINLDGAQAPPVGPEKAKNGEGAKVKGKDGKPGLPGAPGGNFLGVGEKFIRKGTSDLKITSTGGKGGAGQTGGDGGPSSKPEDPKFCEACDEKTRTNFDEQGFRENRHCRQRSGRSTVCDLNMSKIGGSAGDGGNGGAPGLGGLSGLINVISVNNQPVNFTFVAEKGSDGGAGRGGMSGNAIEGNFYITEETVHWIGSQATLRYRWGHGGIYHNVGRNGKDGEEGANEEGRKAAQGPDPPPNYPLAINRYKYYLRESATGKSKNPVPLSFYRKIEINLALNEMYDVSSFADDFQRLETQSMALQKKTAIAPFFESVLPRLANYSGSGNKTDDVRKTLAFLYTAVLSRLSSDRNREGFIVVNIIEFLKSIIGEIDQLKNLENDKIVQSYKDDYVKNVQNSIKEANDLINNEIIPILDNYKEQMTTQIENLSSEVAELKENTKIQKEALQKKKEHLKKTLVWRKVMTGVSALTSMMAFLGPTAAAVGSAINAGARIVESIALSDSQDPTAVLATIPGAVNSQLVSVIQIIESKKSRFSDQLAEIENRIETVKGGDSDKDLKEIKDKVKYTKEELSKIDPKKLDPNAVTTINSLKTGVSKTLSEKKSSISKFQAIDDKQDKKIAAIGYMQATVNAGDMIARGVAQIRATDAQLEEVNQQLIENDETMRKLDRFEEKIHSQMMPMVSNIMDRVDALSTENAGKSHAALDVAQWKSEEYMSDMRGTLKKMTQGFKMSEDLENVMNKIDRAMRTMTQVFQRIQDNQDKRDLAVFIADINSNKASEINVKDEFLNQLLSDIQVSIQRNLILQSFEKGYQSFIQAFFPFGVALIGDYAVQQNLPMTNSTESTITFAKQRIFQMIEKIQVTETSITRYDEHIYNEYPFAGGDSDIFPAFYRWNYEDHQEAISKLLKGETIEMNADITNLHEDNEYKNAIKFTRLRLAVVARDEDLQPKLDKALNKFFIKLKTLGTFYYACNGKYYEISNDAFTIRVTYQMAKNGIDPAGLNDVYKKIKSNGAMFSPYSQWNITLDGKSGLKNLKEFQNKPIDLELVGEGFYVDEESDICETQLHLMYNQLSNYQEPN